MNAFATNIVNGITKGLEATAEQATSAAASSPKRKIIGAVIAAVILLIIVAFLATPSTISGDNAPGYTGTVVKVLENGDILIGRTKAEVTSGPWGRTATVKASDGSSVKYFCPWFGQEWKKQS